MVSRFTFAYDAPREDRVHPRWGILALVAAAQTSNSMLTQGLPPLFAFLQEDYHLNRAEVGLFLSAIQLGTVASFVLGGWAADAFGIRRTLPLAQLVLGVSGIVFSQAGSFHLGLAILPLAGLAIGMGNPSLSLAVLMWFPARGRATAMGIKQTGVPVAGMLSAALLPSIALAYGWYTSIFIVSAASVLFALLTLALYRDPTNARPVGTVPKPTFRQVAKLIRQREIYIVSIFAAVLIADQFTILGYLILYLRDHLDLAVVVGGLILALAQLGAFCGRILLGVFSDLALGGRRVPALGLAGGLATVLLVALALLPTTTPFWLLPPLAFALGFSAMGWHGLRQTLLPELVPRAVAGMAIGVGQMLSEAGPIFGPPFFGALADRAGYRPAWLVMAGLTAVVSVVLLRGLDERRAKAAARAADRLAAATARDAPASSRAS